MSTSVEQRLDYLEESNEALRMQNRVLATALKGMLRALPADIAQDVIESIQIAFDDEVSQLNYEDSPHVELFYDMTYSFFREKE